MSPIVSIEFSIEILENVYVLLFVFLIGSCEQNGVKLLTPVSDSVFMLFHVEPSVLLSMVAI